MRAFLSGTISIFKLRCKRGPFITCWCHLRVALTWHRKTVFFYFAFFFTNLFLFELIPAHCASWAHVKRFASQSEICLAPIAQFFLIWYSIICLKNLSDRLWLFLKFDCVNIIRYEGGDALFFHVKTSQNFFNDFGGLRLLNYRGGFLMITLLLIIVIVVLETRLDVAGLLRATLLVETAPFIFTIDRPILSSKFLA